MKSILIYFMFSITAFSQELYFFKTVEEEKLPDLRIKENTLFIKTDMKIEKIKAPEATSIFAFYQGYGKGRDYQIQINLKKRPAKEWRPYLVIGEDILMFGVSVTRPDQLDLASSLSFESDDPKKILAWVQALKKFYKLDDDRAIIELEPRKEE